MSPDDRIRLRHMVEAAQTAIGFTQGRELVDLDSDAMLRFALVRAIEIVGEAAAQLSTQGRAEMPGLPRSAMVGMRNRLVHAYFDVDHDILRTTVTISLPSLLQSLRPFVDDV